MDLSIWLPIITAFIPILLPMFPGLNKLFVLLPRPFFETIVKIKGGTVTWAPTVSQVNEDYRFEQAILLGRISSGAVVSDEEVESLKARRFQIEQRQSGFMDTILALIGGGGGGSMLMPILLIVGVVVFLPMITGGGGCKKKPATPAPAAVTENPTPGLSPAPVK